MGLLDQLAGDLLGSLGKSNQNSHNPLIEIATSLLLQHGGLDGLLARFSQAGYGDHASSWVGTGANMPIDGASIQDALGGDALGNLASKFGLNADQVAGGLAQVLPELINRMTPNGTTAGSSDLLQEGISILGGMLQARAAR